MSVLSPSQHNRPPRLTERAARPTSEAPHVELRPLSAWSRAARRLVFARLGRLPAQLRVLDADGQHAVGDDAAGVAPQDLTVVDPRFYSCMAAGGALGAGDAFVRGYWSSDDLLALLRCCARSAVALSAMERPWSRALQLVRRRIAASRPQSRRASRRNIAAHYDLSNEFFATFLDPTMTYSCGVFESDKTTLHEASLAKYERLARKLDLAPCDRVVEIGCGWGGFAEFAAARYGCHVTAVTISQRQFAFATRRIADAGLADRVAIRLCDYRDLTGQFDKLVSIEMIEAIGHAQFPTFFRKCSSLLTQQGLMGLQAITIPDQRYARYRRAFDFIQKYIFPGGHLPSLGAMQAAVARASDFRIVHQEDFAEHYARTLLEWRQAFFLAQETIAELGFDASFRRAWDYYLTSCAAGFLERQIGVSQIVLAKPAARGQLQGGLA